MGTSRPPQTTPSVRGSVPVQLLMMLWASSAAEGLPPPATLEALPTLPRLCGPPLLTPIPAPNPTLSYAIGSELDWWSCVRLRFKFKLRLPVELSRSLYRSSHEWAWLLIDDEIPSKIEADDAGLSEVAGYSTVDTPVPTDDAGVVCCWGPFWEGVPIGACGRIG